MRQSNAAFAAYSPTHTPQATRPGLRVVSVTTLKPLRPEAVQSVREARRPAPPPAPEPTDLVDPIDDVDAPLTARAYLTAVALLVTVGGTSLALWFGIVRGVSGVVSYLHAL